MRILAIYRDERLHQSTNTSQCSDDICICISSSTFYFCRLPSPPQLQLQAYIDIVSPIPITPTPTPMPRVKQLTFNSSQSPSLRINTKILAAVVAGSFVLKKNNNMTMSNNPSFLVSLADASIPHSRSQQGCL